ncbi:DUF1573 domain-containing protein [Candidatus Woesearchaeota archaeon]|nr:DUF1573 domain-containing protein [Candidatus Woesearchaeota archaeon]
MDNLTKAQRRKLKREGRKEERRIEQEVLKRKRFRKKIVKNTFIGLIAIIVIAFLYQKIVPPQNLAKIEFSQKEIGLGTVSQALGEVSTLVEISNNGNEDLIISRMDTSCMCTEASIVSDGAEGPRFGMASHGNNPKDWSKTISPGESATLKIYYDPNVHAKMRGTFTRFINIYSNAWNDKKAAISINGMQVD